MDSLRVEYNLFKQESIELKDKLHKSELNKSIQDTKNAYESQLREMRAVLEQANRKYEVDIAALRQAVESSGLAQTNLKKEAETLRTQLVQMEASRNEASRLVTELQNELHLLRNSRPQTVCTHEPEYSHFREKYRQLEQQKLNLERLLDELNLPESQAKNVVQQAQIVQLSGEVAQLKQELHVKDKDLLFYRADHDKMERAKAYTDKEAHAQQTQINVAHKQNLMLMDELKTLRTSNE